MYECTREMFYTADGNLVGHNADNRVLLKLDADYVVAGRQRVANDPDYAPRGRFRTWKTPYS